jgi:SAM-dependent methyltransferase
VTYLSLLYRTRFEKTGLEKRRAVWRTLVSAYFSKLVPKDSDVLELACGYGEFISTVVAKRKYAVDLNPDAAANLPQDITFNNRAATDLSFLTGESIDVVFTSNFLEHLATKEDCSRVFREVHRVLRPEGRFIVLGPNIRFAYREYWDYFDHRLPLSDRSLAEGLIAAGFRLERVIPKFLPFTMNNNRPTWGFLIRIYLAIPLAWRILGRQFLVVAVR